MNTDTKWKTHWAARSESNNNKIQKSRHVQKHVVCPDCGKNIYSYACAELAIRMHKINSKNCRATESKDCAPTFMRVVEE